jgi:hypothetical protein
MVGTAQDAPFAHPTESISNGVIRSHTSAISPQVCARLILNFPPSHNRGRRECRAPDAPAVLRAKMRVARTQVITVTPETPGIPRAMVLRLISRSPRGPGSFAPVVRRANPATLTPASGRQDHTTLPSASSALVSRAISVHRNPPHVRDDRETPLMARRDDLLLSLFLPSRQVKF